MRTLIFFDKPAVSQCVLACLPKSIVDDAYVVHMHLTGPASMDFPRYRALSEYPLVEEPRFVLDDSPRFFAQSPFEAPQPVPQVLPRVERVVFAVDPDPSGIWAFRSALALWAGEHALTRHYEAWLFNALDAASVKRAVRNAGTTAQLDPCYAWAKTKRYIDYQWQNNASVVLARHSGLPGVPSKFGLQLMYLLRKTPFSDEDELLQCMHGWVGTGRFAPVQMGSVSSRYAIFQRLVRLGLVTKTNSAPATIALTPEGHLFLARLHSDCEDLDFPQRINAWCTAGLEVSKPAIDDYMHRFFDKQLCFGAKA